MMSSSQSDELQKVVNQVWFLYHPPLNEDMEPDYNQPAPALPLVNAIAHSLATLQASLEYQLALVKANGKKSEIRDAKDNY